MSFNYIQTVTIDLPNVYSEMPEIGLYTNQLRFSERKLSGVTETYASGYINSIGTINQSANFENGGNSATGSGISISLCNINQLKYELLDVDPNLTLKNCKIYIHEFVGTDDDSDSVSKDVIFVGLIDSADYNDEDLLIKANTMKISRKANMMHILSVDDKNFEVPVVFGSSNPQEEIFFKALRLNNLEDKKTVEEIALHYKPTAQAYGNYFPPEMDQFFVSGEIDEGTGKPSKTFKIKLGYLDTTVLPDASYFIDKWVHVIIGKGSGEHAKIKQCTLIQTGFVAEIQVVLYDYLKTQWVGNSTGTATEQTWVNIVEIDKTYILDNFPSQGFYNSLGQQITTQAELYIKDEFDKGKRIPDFGYDVDISDTKNCSLVINPKLFGSDIDEMTSYSFIPCRRYKYLDYLEYQNVKDWTTIDHGLLHGMNRTVKDGFFFDTSISNISIDLVDSTDISEQLFADKNLATYHSMRFDISYSNTPTVSSFWRIGKFLTLELPRLQKDFDFSNVYLGIATDEWHMYTSGGQYGGSYENQQITTKYYAAKRKILGPVESLTSFSMESLDGRTCSIDNLPDFYIPRNTENVNFYTESTTPEYLRTKYNLIDLKITSREEYGNIYEILFGHIYLGGTSNVTYIHNDTVKTRFNIKELFLIFETSASVKEEIYV